MREHTLPIAALCLGVVVASACASVEPEPSTNGGSFDDDDNDDGGDGGASSSGGRGATSSSGGPSTSSSSGTPAGGTLSAGDQVWTLDVAGKARSVRVHVPAAIADQALPVVIALHGNGDDAANFETTSGLKAHADSSGYVLLTPDGIPRDVSVGGSTAPKVPWDAYNLYENNWDLQLMTALRERVQATGSVEPSKVSVYGFSQGGYMAYRVAAALSSDFSCAAVLSAADPSGYPVPFTRPIPISMMIGTSDYGIDRARETDAALTTANHEHEYVEIPGLGHALAPAPQRFEPLDYCLGKSL